MREDDDRLKSGDGERAPSAEAVYSKGVELLGLRPHFRAELVEKLRRRGFPREEVEATADRLETKGYLNDLEAARGFATMRTSRRNWGPRRLKAELGRRGVEEGVVETVVDEQFADGELEAAQEAAGTWAQRGRGGRDGLARYLDRRGFSTGTIVEILNQFGPGSAPGAGESRDEQF